MRAKQNAAEAVRGMQSDRVGSRSPARPGDAVASRLRRWTLGLAAAALALPLATEALAAHGDCGQPLSNTAAPVASDCLYVLKTAVGSTSCEDCVCDTNGSSTITASDALLCLRVAVGQPAVLACPACQATTTTTTTSTTLTPVCTGPLAPTNEQFAAAFAASLDADGNIEGPVSCGTGVPVCCPGGIPAGTCGPLHVELTDVAFDVPQGQNRVDLTLTVKIASVADLPVTVPIVGDCLLKIDTAPGPLPTVKLQFPLNLAANGLEVQSVGSVTITDLTADDLAIEGSFSCQLASFGLSFYLGVLGDTFATQVVQLDGLCLGHLATP